MSQILHGAHSDLGWLMGTTTVVFFSLMVAWTVWTFAPSRRQLMDEASRLPLEGGD